IGCASSCCSPDVLPDLSRATCIGPCSVHSTISKPASAGVPGIMAAGTKRNATTSRSAIAKSATADTNLRFDLRATEGGSHQYGRDAAFYRAFIVNWQLGLSWLPHELS